MSALAMTYEGACFEGMNSSALEHSVPEQLFSTPESPAYGVSAVKAIQIAASQGMPIYTVTKDNADTVIPQLQLDEGTITEIQNAVNAGNEVTVSKSFINFHGWIGCGYIVMNQVTGTGAYMISGQESGAAILRILGGILLLPLGAGNPIIAAGGIYYIVSGIVNLIKAIAGFYMDVTYEFWYGIAHCRWNCTWWVINYCNNNTLGNHYFDCA